LRLPDGISTVTSIGPRSVACVTQSVWRSS
jgi:hypothetical protein